MRITVQADDGDEVAISADVISAEQALVTLTIENSFYEPEGELESLKLTVENARELATALMSVADAIEFVNTSAESLRMTQPGPHGGKAGFPGPSALRQ